MSSSGSRSKPDRSPGRRATPDSGDILRLAISADSRDHALALSGVRRHVENCLDDLDIAPARSLRDRLLKLAASGMIAGDNLAHVLFALDLRNEIEHEGIVTKPIQVWTAVVTLFAFCLTTNGERQRPNFGNAMPSFTFGSDLRKLDGTPPLMSAVFGAIPDDESFSDDERDLARLELTYQRIHWSKCVLATEFARLSVEFESIMTEAERLKRRS